MPKMSTNQCELTPQSISAASAMPARSAPTLIVLAAKSAKVTMRISHRGKRLRNVSASPRPVTIPIRAHIICTAAISGQVSGAVQSNAVPCCAPAMEYVAMPDGSSSAAPVIRPGPSLRRNRVTGFFGPDFSAKGLRGECGAFIFQPNRAPLLAGTPHTWKQSQQGLRKDPERNKLPS